MKDMINLGGGIHPIKGPGFGNTISPIKNTPQGFQNTIHPIKSENKGFEATGIKPIRGNEGFKNTVKPIKGKRARRRNRRRD